MGNVIKIDFDGKIIPYENPIYRKDIQQKFIQTYGSDEHKATLIIVQGLGCNQRIQDLVKSTRFSQASNLLLHQDLWSIIPS